MARSRSILFVSPGRFRNINGVLSLQRKLAKIPDAVVAEIKPALEKGADDLVDRLRTTLPASDDLSAQPGHLRASAHREAGPHDLAVAVVVDARDENGELIPAHVEYGHLAPDGSHVAAVPAFWPTYQVSKKRIRSRVQRAATKGVKKAVAGGGGNNA